jgi:hypothetical protein
MTSYAKQLHGSTQAKKRDEKLKMLAFTYSIYVHNPWIKTSNQSVCTGELRESRGQLEGKYFDYNGVSPDCPNNPEEKVFRLLRLQDRRLRLATLGGSSPRTRAN